MELDPAPNAPAPAAGLPSAQRETRRAGWAGVAFVILLVVSAGMVSAPGSGRPGSAIAVFYAANETIILIAQAIGIVAAFVFLYFGRRFVAVVAGAPGGRGEARALLTVYAVFAASLVTAVPILALAVLAGRGLDARTAEILARLADWSDIILFLAIAAFFAVVALAEYAPEWLKVFAVIGAFLALARGLTGPFSVVALFEIASPVAFVLFIAAASVWMLVAKPTRARGPAPSSA